MNPSAKEGASAPSVEVIRECCVYALHQLEDAEESELYTCGMHHLNQIILFRASLSLAKGFCA